MSDRDRGGDDEFPPIPTETFTPLAERVDRVFRLYDYEVRTAMDAIDEAIPGIGGLFALDTSTAELRTALDAILEADSASGRRTDDLGEPTPAPEALILYVDGASRGNPGPAGAGAAILDPEETPLVRLGRPVGSNAGNNAAEYAALALGLDRVVTRYAPARLEVRIDSMTVIRDVWEGRDGDPAFAAYRRAIEPRLAAVPSHDWTHLADHEPNPADALATVGADVAALGPGG
jgi:ribonuclease HI